MVKGEAMTDFKKLIEDATDIPTEDTAFENGHKLPFCVFLDRQDVDGDDDQKTQTVDHETAIEFYAARIDAANEMQLEALFKNKGWKYSKDREYLADEKCFETIYQIQFTERI